MRFLPAILSKIHRPVPLATNAAETRLPDEITRDIDAAVTEHERVATAECADYAARVQETIDDLLERMGKAK